VPQCGEYEITRTLHTVTLTPGAIRDDGVDGRGYVPLPILSPAEMKNMYVLCPHLRPVKRDVRMVACKYADYVKRRRSSGARARREWWRMAEPTRYVAPIRHMREVGPCPRAHRPRVRWREVVRRE